MTSGTSYSAYASASVHQTTQFLGLSTDYPQESFDEYDEEEYDEEEYDEGDIVDEEEVDEELEEARGVYDGEDTVRLNPGGYYAQGGYLRPSQPPSRASNVSSDSSAPTAIEEYQSDYFGAYNNHRSEHLSYIPSVSPIDMQLSNGAEELTEGDGYVLNPHNSFVPATSVYDPSRSASTLPFQLKAGHDLENLGPYRRALYQPPRSRSATPMDEVDLGDKSMPAALDYGEDEDAFSNAEDSRKDLEKVSIPDTPFSHSETRHFGPAPIRAQARRHGEKKRVQLKHGHYVRDMPVSNQLLLPKKGTREMTETRYTAVTCDPDDFVKKKFTLRQVEYNRRTEMFIVITMFNEDDVLFCRTLYGVMKNIAHLCSRKNSSWGPEGWKKVVVCIVSDGRKQIHPRVLDCLTALGVIQPHAMKNMVLGQITTAHMWEYTASFALDADRRFRYPESSFDIVPTQILFCLKEKNAKKINSHRWFFNAFAPVLQPNVCVLLDVGTRPGPKSLYYLWKAFDLNSNVGGACGEIAVYKGKWWRGLLNPLVASQHYEYKMSNILDKPAESAFGYINVLPGAFSAYRYIALQNDKTGVGPLASYFKGEVLSGQNADMFTANMYLAEDRILCFELISRPGADWVLRYVKSAVGETDVPDTLAEFIGQRRRWLNGSFFATIYALAHVGQVLRSGHSVPRKVVLLVEFVYNLVNVIFAWFAIGNFYIFFVILTTSVNDASFNLKGVAFFNTLTQYCYAGTLIACFLFSMGNRPKGSQWKYKFAVVSFALLTVWMLVCAVLCTIKALQQFGTPIYSRMVLSLIATYGSSIVASVFFMDPWHLITSFIQYMLLSPMFINVLNIYAFSNLHDFSWGTKAITTVDTDLGVVRGTKDGVVEIEVDDEKDDIDKQYMQALHNLKVREPVPRATGKNFAAEEESLKDYYANVRTNVLLSWALSNAFLAVSILSGNTSSAFDGSDNYTITKGYMLFILVFVAMTSIVRFSASTFYLLARVFTG